MWSRFSRRDLPKRLNFFKDPGMCFLSGGPSLSESWVKGACWRDGYSAYNDLADCPIPRPVVRNQCESRFAVVKEKMTLLAVGLHELPQLSLMERLPSHTLFVIILRVENLMTESCTLWMILRIVHDVAKEPSTRTFFEIRIVECAVRGIAIRSCHNGINDVRRV